MKIIQTILQEFDRKTQMRKRAQIGEALWPASTPLAREINLYNLIKGRTKKVAPSDIVVICKVLEVTPNTLFSWSE